MPCRARNAAPTWTQVATQQALSFQSYEQTCKILFQISARNIVEMPLYRQHQRLRDAGIQVSRHWLTHLMQQTVGLLEPIHDAQLESIRAGRVIAMDETPIKAGPTGTGKMKAAYFWPVYGEQDEISFLYYPSLDRLVALIPPPSKHRHRY